LPSSFKIVFCITAHRKELKREGIKEGAAREEREEREEAKIEN
jgi:hypothetical protein